MTPARGKPYPVASWGVVAPGVWRLRLGRPERHTPVSVFRPRPEVAALSALPSVSDPPLDISMLRWELTPRGCLVILPLEPSEHVFGLGLQLMSHDQTTRKKTLRVNSDPIADTGDSHAPVPFYVSTRGYGVLFDTARYASFYCGSHTPADAPPPRLEPKDGVPADNAEHLYRRSRIARGPMVVEIPCARGVDVYLFGGPTLRHAVQRYVLFSGGGCLPPMWGLGVWYRAYIRHTQDEVLALARELRERRLPCDVFGLEPGWHSHAYPCTFQWHPMRFADPGCFLDEMRRLGFRVNLWEHVFVHPDSPLYHAAQKAAGTWRVWGGVVPDLLDPDVARAFADYHDRHFVSRGCDGFKLDECDNSDFIAYPWSFPEHSRFPSGVDGEQMHCLLGVLYQRLILDLFRRHNRRTLSQVRSSHALAAPYPFVLYSDLYDHEDFIRGIITAGYSGLLWCPEVRQCAGVEDWVRRIQTVVCSPLALVNGWMLRHPPWKQLDRERNLRGEWRPDWVAVEALTRRVFRWRMRLIPYLYAAFARYRFEGTPPFRSLAMDYPDDPNAWNVSDEYLMGDHVLVAPLRAGQQARAVYLPKGRWYRVDGRGPLDGRQAHTIEASLEEMPIFVREGSLLPLARPPLRVRPDHVWDLTVYAYGVACRPFHLFEDDGETYDYEKGQYNWVTIEWRAGRGPSLVRDGRYPQARYRVRRWRQFGG